MSHFDFSPLFRSAIGFDRMTDALESAYRTDNSGGYPPYNIELTGDDAYRITMAVAGFSRAELDIEVKQNILRVNGAKKDDAESRHFLHRGIANRSFERSFQLADYVRVDGAEIIDGLLHIQLVREIPEAMKPRRIEISGETDRVIENKANAA